MVFDRELLSRLINEQGVTDQEGLQALLATLTKEVVETALEGELTAHLGYQKHSSAGRNSGNSRNGKNTKSVKSAFGPIDLDVPRDRDASFDPQMVKKRQRDISGIEDKVISMYAKGMSTRDISSHIEHIYGFGLSADSISAITDKVIDRAKQWQNRSLEQLYAIVYMDGMIIKMRSEGVVKNVTVYVIIGIAIDGKKSCLGLYIAPTESAKYWLSVMNELKNRGVQDVLIFAVDNLSGISEAIMAAFPHSEIQKCIVHQIRTSLRFVTWKERKVVAEDLKPVYKAPTEESALQNLDLFAQKWDGRYPHIAKSWRKNWVEISPFFKFSKAIRTLMYTTNPIETFNRGIRKVTKTRAMFPTKDSALKLLYLATEEMEQKWRWPLPNWGEVFSELMIFFGERVERYV